MATAARYLHSRARTGIRLHIDLRPTRLRGSVGDPVAIGRKSSIEDAWYVGEYSRWLGGGLHRQQPGRGILGSWRERAVHQFTAVGRKRVRFCPLACIE